jgi:uncharacterized protein (DUF433 family)
MSGEISTRSAGDETDETYAFLERRPKSWRRQLFLKGRNIAVGQLVYNMRADGLTPAEAAQEYRLPLAQIQEALAYYRNNRDLIEQDADDERRYLESKGLTIEPAAVSR